MNYYCFLSVREGLIHSYSVIPAHAGIQFEPEFYGLDSGSCPGSSPGLGRNDGKIRVCLVNRHILIHGTARISNATYPGIL
jgi:hypothetical protein